MAGPSGQDDTNKTIDTTAATPENVSVQMVDDAGAVITESYTDPKTEVQAYDDKVKDDLAKWQAEAESYRARFEEMQGQLDDVVRYAQSQVNENKRLSGLIKSGEQVLVTQAGGRVKAELAAAEASFKKAYEDGDSEAMLKAQKDIARLSVEDAQVRQYQPINTDPPQQQQYRPQQQQAPQADAKSKAWQDKNAEWWMKNKPMTGYALGLHEDLVRRGVKPGTDEYIAGLDKGMAEAFPTKFSAAPDTGNGGAPRVRTQGAVVSPVTRTASGKSTTVQITPSMAAMARKLGVPVETYAKELARLNENG